MARIRGDEDGGLSKPDALTTAIRSASGGPQPRRVLPSASMTRRTVAQPRPVAKGRATAPGLIKKPGGLPPGQAKKTTTRFPSTIPAPPPIAPTPPVGRIAPPTFPTTKLPKKALTYKPGDEKVTLFGKRKGK